MANNVKIVLTLTKAEYVQLMSYIEDRDIEGWYYGNKKHFENRHKSIINKLKKLGEER